MKLIKRIIDEIVFWRHFRLNPCDIYGEQVAKVKDCEAKIVMLRLTDNEWAAGLRGVEGSYTSLLARGTFKDCKKFYKDMWMRNVGIGRNKEC